MADLPFSGIRGVSRSTLRLSSSLLINKLTFNILTIWKTYYILVIYTPIILSYHHPTPTEPPLSKSSFYFHVFLSTEFKLLAWLWDYIQVTGNLRKWHVPPPFPTINCLQISFQERQGLMHVPQSMLEDNRLSLVQALCWISGYHTSSKGSISWHPSHPYHLYYDPSSEMFPVL